MPGSDSSSRYRAMGFWALSVVVHAVLSVILALTGWSIVRAESANEFEAGIMVRRAVKKQIVFEGRDRRVRAPDAVQPKVEAAVEEVPAEDLDQLLKDDRELDTAAVPEATDVLTDAAQLLPPGPVGGVPPGFGKTSFFGREAVGSKFVYVLDRSYSMDTYKALEHAKKELLRSLGELPATARFQIIFYNDDYTPMIIEGERKLAYATKPNKAFARRYVREIQPSGGTDHVPPVKRAMSMGADVIFFLTDADEMSRKEADNITHTNRGRARIHCIEFGIGVRWMTSNNLARVARDNGGTYRYINITRFKWKPSQTNTP